MCDELANFVETSAIVAITTTNPYRNFSIACRLNAINRLSLSTKMLLIRMEMERVAKEVQKDGHIYINIITLRCLKTKLSDIFDPR